MDDISKKREKVKQAYPHSKTWSSKVSKMPDSQIVAVYLRLEGQGKLK